MTTTTTTGLSVNATIALDAYAVTDDSGGIVETWPKTPDGSGVITATTRACYLSRRGGRHEVHRPDGRMLARYVGGRRADLPPGGIVRLAKEKAAL